VIGYQPDARYLPWKSRYFFFLICSIYGFQSVKHQGIGVEWIDAKIGHPIQDFFWFPSTISESNHAARAG